MENEKVEIKTRKEMRRNLWALFFRSIIHGFGLSMVNVVLQPYILELTNSIFLTGIIVSIGGMVQFLPLPIIGWLSDKFGRKNIILFGVPVAIAGLAVLIFSPPSDFGFVLIGIILFYLGLTIDIVNRQFLISESSEKSKGLMYSLMAFSYFFGSIGGTVLIMVNIVFDVKIYFIIFGAILIVEWFIYEIFLSDQHRKNMVLEAEQGVEPVEHGKLWKKIFLNPRSRAALIFFTLDLFIYSISFSIYNAGLRDFYNLSDGEIATLSFWVNVSTMVCQIPAGRLADKIGKKKSLIISQIGGLAFFGINILGFVFWINGLGFLLLYLLIGAHILFGLSIATFIPSEQMIMTDLDEHRKAQSYGIVGFVRGIGYIPTGAIGGFLVESVHYIAPFIITMIGICFEIWFLVRYFHD